jgi:hypothetical protein
VRALAAYRYRRTIGHGRANCVRYVLSRSYRQARWADLPIAPGGTIEVDEFQRGYDAGHADGYNEGRVDKYGPPGEQGGRAVIATNKVSTCGKCLPDYPHAGGRPFCECECHTASAEFLAGWAAGWAARSEAEDHSALIGRRRQLKPQDGAFFLLGEIERAAAE